jgi:hypothetical protein
MDRPTYTPSTKVYFILLQVIAMTAIATLPPVENPPTVGSSAIAENPPPGTLTENLPWMRSQELKEVKQQMAHLEALLNFTEPNERAPLLKQWVALRTRKKELEALEAPAKNEARAKNRTVKATEKKTNLRLSKFKALFRVLRSRHEALEGMQVEVERLQLIYNTAVREENTSIQSDYGRLSQAYDNLDKHKETLRLAEDEYMALGTPKTATARRPAVNSRPRRD